MDDQALEHMISYQYLLGNQVALCRLTQVGGLQCSVPCRGAWAFRGLAGFLGAYWGRRALAYNICLQQDGPCSAQPPGCIIRALPMRKARAQPHHCVGATLPATGEEPVAPESAAATVRLRCDCLKVLQDEIVACFGSTTDLSPRARNSVAAGTVARRDTPCRHRPLLWHTDILSLKDLWRVNLIL